MQHTKHPMRRVGLFSTAIVLSCGLAVMGGGAAFADDLVAPAADTAVVQPAADTTPTSGDTTPTDTTPTDTTPTDQGSTPVKPEPDVSNAPPAADTGTDAPASDGTDGSGSTPTGTDQTGTDSGAGSTGADAGSTGDAPVGDGSTTTPTDNQGTTDEPTVQAPLEQQVDASAYIDWDTDGYLQVGSKAYVDTYDWADDTTFTYQWSLDGIAIPGATGDTYTVVDGDAGKDLSVSVTGTSPEFADTTVTDGDYTVTQDLSFGTDSVSYVLSAGSEFTRTFEPKGYPAADHYEVSGTLPSGVTFKDGTFTGKPTVAGTYTVWLYASRDEFMRPTVPYSPSSASLKITLSVAPGPVKGIGAEFVPVGAASSGNTYALSSGEHGSGLTVQQGSSIFVGPFSFDEYGNTVGGADPQFSVTSSVASDSITYSGGLATVTFNHASPHTLTVTYAGQTVSQLIEVTPSVVTPTPETPVVVQAPVAAAGTVSTTTTAAATTTVTKADGSLAYTGSDDSGLLAWALGLVAAGAAVTVLRFRRRRTQR